MLPFSDDSIVLLLILANFWVHFGFEKFNKSSMADPRWSQASNNQPSNNQPKCAWFANYELQIDGKTCKGAS